jgi:hypothetical protein
VRLCVSHCVHADGARADIEKLFAFYFENLHSGWLAEIGKMLKHFGQSNLPFYRRRITPQSQCSAHRLCF